MIFRSKKGAPAGEMPFLDHLEELRWRLLKIVTKGVDTSAPAKTEGAS